MKFNRIDENTINCVITQDDLIENGIDLDDLLKRTPKAMDYLRRVILEAAQAEHFQITGEFTSMQVRIMKDQSISLTLSQGKKASDLAGALAGVEDTAGAAGNGTGQTIGNGTAGPGFPGSGAGISFGTAGAGQNHSAGKIADGAAGKNNAPDRPAIYAFTFNTMDEAIECCRKVADAEKLPSSLYYDDEEAAYYLFFTSPGDDEVKFEKTILAMNEFGTFVEVTPSEVAYIKEHKKCILKENAARRLIKL